MPSHQQKSVSSSSRARLLAAAKRLFAAQGYEQSATSAIAREAGTSESQLMRYFGGKAGLLEALFDDAWEQLNARVAKTISAKTHRHDALIAAFEVVVSGLARDSDLATLFLFEGRRLRGDEPRVSLSRGSRAVHRDDSRAGQRRAIHPRRRSDARRRRGHGVASRRDGGHDARAAHGQHRGPPGVCPAGNPCHPGAACLKGFGDGHSSPELARGAGFWRRLDRERRPLRETTVLAAVPAGPSGAPDQASAWAHRRIHSDRSGVPPRGLRSRA